MGKPHVHISNMNFKTSKNKKLVVIVPGIFQNIKEYNFLKTTKCIGYDFYIYNYPNLDNPNIDFSQIVLDFNNKISSIINEYNIVYIVTYSSGSELFLRSNHIETFKKIVFLSPSLFTNQNISATLTRSTKRPGLLLLNNGVEISQKLAEDLDSFDTTTLEQPHGSDWRIYIATDDANSFNWDAEVRHLNHGHAYTDAQFAKIFNEVIIFFR